MKERLPLLTAHIMDKKDLGSQTEKQKCYERMYDDPKGSENLQNGFKFLDSFDIEIHVQALSILNKVYKK